MAMQATRAAAWTTLLVLTLAAVGCGGGGGGPPGEDAPAPTLTQVSPDSSFPSGGIAITVRGSGFLDDAPGTNAVRIGNLAASSVVVVSDTELTCQVPAGVAGLVDVQVSNDNGTARLTDAFTYFVDPPAFQPSGQSVSRDEPGVTQSEFAEVCCAGDYVYAAWQDARTTAGGFDIYFNRSTDGGATWMASDVRLDTDGTGASDAVDVQICCAGSAVYVLWLDDRSGNYEVYFNRSLDHGATWLPVGVRVSNSTGVGFAADAKLCCDGSNVHVVWRDARNGSTDIYYNRSTDGGATWRAADTRIESDALGASTSRSPAIHCSGAGRVYVVWADARNDPSAPSVYFNRSIDGGTTWLPADVRVDHDLLNVGAASTPRICDTGTALVVVWSDDRNGDLDIFANRSIDGGSTWSTTDQRLNTDGAGLARSTAARVCCAGDTVGVVWSDRRSGTQAVHFNRSLDGGSSWLAQDRRINESVSGTQAARPRICCTGVQMYVVWFEDRHGPEREILFNRSTDAGASWLATDVRLDTNPDLVGGDSSTPRICCEGARVHVVWHDWQSGSKADIYASSTTPE